MFHHSVCYSLQPLSDVSQRSAVVVLGEWTPALGETGPLLENDSYVIITLVL